MKNSYIVINSFSLIKILLLIFFKIQEKFLKSIINGFIWGTKNQSEM